MSDKCWKYNLVPSSAVSFVNIYAFNSKKDLYLKEKIYSINFEGLKHKTLENNLKTII